MTRAVLALSFVTIATSSCSSSGSAADGSTPAPTSTVTCGGGSVAIPEHIYDVTNFRLITGATISAPGCITGVTDAHGFQLQ